MSNSATTITPENAKAFVLSKRQAVGAAANEAAARHVFDDYLSRKSANTIRNHKAGLSAFADYLGDVGFGEVSAETLQTDPSSWTGVTWGLVEAFVRWMLQIGYSISTVNNRLSAVKTYAKLAAKAGIIPQQEYQLIKVVTGYSRTEGKRVDEQRDVVRVGRKKQAHVPISLDQARQLKNQPPTPQGKRDVFLMCLLLDHGLRVSEVAILKREDFDLTRGEVRFYRPKIDKIQTHRLSADTHNALHTYLSHAPSSGKILLGSRKNGELKGQFSIRAIANRVNKLGELVGIVKLSPHDCRHYWATNAARAGTDPFALQEAGGWSSLAMPRRYVEAAAVANEKVQLST